MESPLEQPPILEILGRAGSKRKLGVEAPSRCELCDTGNDLDFFELLLHSKDWECFLSPFWISETLCGKCLVRADQCIQWW